MQGASDEEAEGAVPPADVFVLTLPSGAPTTSLLQAASGGGAGASSLPVGAAGSARRGDWAHWLAVLQAHGNTTLHAVILIGDTCTNGLPSP